MPVNACAPTCTNWCTSVVRAEDHPVADVHVAGELACVGEDGVVADLAVVREVHVGHDPVVVADARDAGVLRRAAVDGDVLADGVAVADLDRGGLARVLLVLRRRADARRSGRCGCAGRCACGPSITTCAPIQRALADLDVRDRSREYGPTSTSRREPRARVDDRGRMDAAGHGSAGLHGAAGWSLRRRPRPPTRATQRELADAAQHALELDFELELVARHHRLLEARVVDADVVVDRLARRSVPAAQRRRARRRPAPSPRGSARRA